MSEHARPSIRLPIAFIDELSHADCIESVLRIGTKWLTAMVQTVRASLSILDGDILIAHTLRSDGVADPFYDKTTILPGTPRDKVMRTGRPVFMNESAMRVAETRPLKLLLDSGIRSILLVPMLSGDRAIGTLSVGWANSCEFDPDLCRDLMAIGQWIASQAHLMQQLRATAHQAETDALTGLANRARLMRVLDGPGTMHLAGTDGSIIGVLHIDLDHFKTVNDTQGHSVGDAILRHAAQVMLSETGPKDIVARTGGDEFIIAARTDPHGHRLSWLARQLVDRIALPVCIDGVKARVGASIGTAMANEQDRTADRLIANADIALYEVKRNGRGGVMAFKPEMRIAYESSQRVLAELQDAVTQASFVPYFQPQVSMTTGRLTGFEMLARWPHPKLGLLVPEEFLDLAAETRLLDQIDTIVRSKGLKALKKLRAEGWQAPKMSFNASVNTLRDPDLVDGLLYEVKAEGLSPSDLVLEIREAQLVDFSDTEVQDNIRKLSDSGFKVELDEFGTGFTSMSNLPNLAISGVKLDRKIIAPLPDICSESILRAIITLARDLDLTVVAGGVETPAQFAILRNLGCHIAQGFGVSHPLPLDELITFMQGYGSAPVALAI